MMSLFRNLCQSKSWANDAIKCEDLVIAWTAAASYATLGGKYWYLLGPKLHNRASHDKRREKLLTDHPEKELSRMQDHQARRIFASRVSGARMTSKREQGSANWSRTIGSWIH